MAVKTTICMGGIITYNPEIDRLTQCIQKAAQECQKVVVVDNGSANFEDIVQLVEKFENSYIIKNESNFGIAKALNQVFHEAAKQNYDWVLTLDQDTVIPDNLMERYSQAISNVHINLAIICPQIHDDLSGKTWPVLNENERERCVEKCITSASLNNVKMWDAVGGFDEKLFIDEVDHDYCYRVRKSKGEILLVDNVTINHTIGNSLRSRSGYFQRKIYFDLAFVAPCVALQTHFHQLEPKPTNAATGKSPSPGHGPFCEKTNRKSPQTFLVYT